MKWIDMPPVWLIAAIAAAWALSQVFPEPGFGSWAGVAAPALILAGAVVMALAVVEFLRARTTIIPGHEPSALITTGIYRFSRNPIYLADTLFLAGAILWWNALAALPLVPIFMWVIRVRFILPEEAVLAERYTTVFSTYREGTRRWI